MKLDQYLSPSTTINSKWMEDLNVKIRILDEYISTINKKDGMNLKKNKEGYMGEFRGKERKGKLCNYYLKM